MCVLLSPGRDVLSPWLGIWHGIWHFQLLVLCTSAQCGRNFLQWLMSSAWLSCVAALSVISGLTRRPPAPSPPIHTELLNTLSPANLLLTCSSIVSKEYGINKHTVLIVPDFNFEFELYPNRVILASDLNYLCIWNNTSWLFFRMSVRINRDYFRHRV